MSIRRLLVFRMKNYRFNLNTIINKLKETGFMHIFGSSIINQMVSFLSGIILVRIISKVDYGIYSYTNNIMAFFLLFSGFGIVSGVLQICSEQQNNPNLALKIYKFGFRIGFFVNILLSLIIFVFSVFVELPIRGANELLSIMSILPLFTIFYELIQIYFRYNRFNKKYSYFASTNTIIILIFSIIGAVLWSVRGLIVFRYFGYIVSIIIGVLILRFPFRKIYKRENSTEVNKSDLYKLSFISMANNATGHLIYILDIFIIGLIIPNETIIASYKVATIIPNALVFIPGSLMVYLYPYFAQHNGDKQWVKEKFHLILKYFGLFNLLISTVLIIFAPIIISLIFGEQYLDAVLPFRLLSLGYLISSTFRKVVGNLLVTQRRLKFNFWLGIFEGILNIIFNIILVTSFGSVGAAVSSLIVVTLSSIIGVRYFIKVIS